MRKTIIIANQNEYPIPPYEALVSNEEYHSQKIKEYVDLYSINLSWENLEIKPDTYYGENWQKGIAALGFINLNILINDDLRFIVIYLPEKISKNQMEWFLKNIIFLLQNWKNIAFEVIDENKQVIITYDYSFFTLRYLYQYLKGHLVDRKKENNYERIRAIGNKFKN